MKYQRKIDAKARGLHVNTYGTKEEPMNSEKAKNAKWIGKKLRTQRAHSFKIGLKYS